MIKIFEIIGNTIQNKEFIALCNRLWFVIIPIWIFLIIYGQDIKAWRIKSFQKQKQNSEYVLPTITINNISGTVESIHPWGRTEVVPIIGVVLKYFKYSDEWVMYGDIIQPYGRKNYFMPILTGRLDLNVKEMTQTWINHDGLIKDFGKEEERIYRDFRMAVFDVKKDEIVGIEYTHYRLLPDNTWTIIASWKTEQKK